MIQHLSPKRALLAVGLGGFLGTIARFWISTGIQHWLGQDWPYEILFVNVTGAFLLAILTIFAEGNLFLGPTRKHFVTVGILGSYTTFSSLALGNVYLWQAAAWWSALGYLCSSLFFGMIAVWLGHVVGQRWVSHLTARRASSVGQSTSLGD